PGLVTQGDYVNLTIVGQCKGLASNSVLLAAGADATTPGAATGCAASLYQKVRILGIGRSLGTGVSTPVATPGAEAPATTLAPTSDLITFEVPQEAAQVIQAAGSGQIYMTLVRKDYQPHPLPVTPYLPTDGVAGKTPY